jgi:hypothetical protein
LLDERIVTGQRADAKREEQTRWRRAASAENVGAVGTLLGVADLAMHGMPGLAVALGATAIGVVSRGQAKSRSVGRGSSDLPNQCQCGEALREAIGSVPHVEEDQILAPLAALEERERAEALGLAMVVTCYVLVDACGGRWPARASVKRVAGALATGTTTAKRLHLDAEEIYAYLSRVVLGPEQMEDVIADEPTFTRLPLIVAGEDLAVLSPKEMGMWEYLDRIESAIEVASALDASVLPAAVMRAYLVSP